MKKLLLALLGCCTLVAGAFIIQSEKAEAPIQNQPTPTTPSVPQDPIVPPTEAPIVETEPAVVETEPVVEEAVVEETVPEETVEETDENRTEANIEPVQEVTIVVHELLPENQTDYPDDGQLLYATHWINVRAEPNTKSDIIGRIEEDERIFRFETANGWSKIWYDNGIGYIYNRYLGTAQIEDFDLYEDVDEIVYSGHDVNIRLAPSTYAPSIGKLAQGESVRRIGIGKNGWSQVIYKNQLFFINSTYLSTDPDFKIPLDWFLNQETEPDETNTGFEETEPMP